MFEPTTRNINKSDWICLPCEREHNKSYRAKRKANGNPVVSGKMPRQWHKEYEALYYQRDDVKKRRAELMQKYRNDPKQRHKHIARWLVNRAVKYGRLVKQPCEVCGCEKVDAHHEDYFQPLLVSWLCRICHTQEHTKARGEG